ncbi:ABC transporter permease [Limnoglobus roseus]|uniref:ABC transporter permease n=1 Tax=Limnoglobus roseus TaxID=2598579 RepID=A0A5C1AP89_9BACT|nr:ABC transporter permease [Limnoglobus roseus]QEL20981.1 ABC transporter permease [Limnoglobus roseus]
MTSPAPSAVRAFFALVRLTFLRHWRIRTLAWVTFGLVFLTATAIAVYTHGPVGWRLENRPGWIADIKTDGAVRMTHRQYAEERLPLYAFFPGPPGQLAIKLAPIAAVQFLLVSEHPEAEKFRDDYAFLRFSRWVVFGLFLGFVMPLFVLAYASGAIGGERESRTLIWLATRPMPRGAVYLAKFLGVLPWCVAVSVAGFAAVCLAGGELGRLAFEVYLPAVFAGTIGLSALFHLMGAIFRRPAVVGLVYVFFFETLVANLPGSLKRLSLNYYVRSMMYNEASTVAVVPEDQLEVYDPVTPTTAWVVLLAASIVLTLVGMWWFAKLEPKDDV